MKIMDRYHKFVEICNYDDKLLVATKKIPNDKALKKARKSIEYKYLRTWRFCSVFHGTIIGKIRGIQLRHYANKTGIQISPSTKIGRGIVIGHKGTIIINSQAVIGDCFVIAQGTVIGRDMRGERCGVPTIGDRVCIHANAVIVGNITIGNDVLIAPNAFVNFDVPDHSIVVGNPGVIHHRDNATEGHIGVVIEDD